jgi:hypothetical protein
MDKQAIQSICVQIYRRFPELKGRSPQIKGWAIINCSYFRQLQKQLMGMPYHAPSEWLLILPEKLSK